MVFRPSSVSKNCSLPQIYYFSFFRGDRGDPAFFGGGTLGGGHRGQCRYCLSLFCQNDIELSQKIKYDCCICLGAMNKEWHSEAEGSRDSFDEDSTLDYLTPDYQCPFDEGKPNLNPLKLKANK